MEFMWRRESHRRAVELALRRDRGNVSTGTSAELLRVDGWVWCWRRPEPRGALRTCRTPRWWRRPPPGRPGLVGVRHRELAEPNRARRITRAGRLLHSRLLAEH